MTDTAAPSRGDRVRHELFAYLELLAVSWLAFAQPLLGTFQEGAETFVFRRASTADIVLFTLVLTFGPALVGYVVEVGIGLLDHTVRVWFHRVLLAAALGLFAVEVALRQVTVAPFWYWTLAVVVAGLAVLLLTAWARAAQVFLRFLSVAPFVFAALFLFTAPVNQVAFADGTLTADGLEIDDPPPLVMVVFDELPTASLLGADGSIDRELFPNFARFADDATWFRNYSTVSPTTPEAVPALLSGRYPEELDALPTSTSHPDNLFTLLAGAYELNVWEQATQLCPPDTCPEAGTVDASGLDALFADAGSVWTDLLTVRSADTDDEPFKVRQSDPAAPNRFADFVDSIVDSRVPRLDFIHVLLPHQPWRHLPSGKRHNAEFIAEGLDDAYRWRDAFFAQAARQRHLLQLQRTDAALGTLLDRLQSLDRYDESLIVLTADHGVSFTAGEPIRGVSEGNQEQTMWTPLLVKAPGQHEATIDDTPVQSVDLLPTLAEMIGVDLPFPVDGTAAGDRDADDDLRRIYHWDRFSDLDRFPGEDYALVEGPPTFEALLDLPTWPTSDRSDLRLYRFGRWGSLVGQPLSGLTVDGEPDHLGELADPDTTLKDDDVDLDLAAVDLAGEVLPTYLRGTLDTTEPVDVIVAVNGTVAGWCPSFVDTKQAPGTQSFFTMVPEQVLVDGVNDVQIFTVPRGGDGTTADDVVLRPVGLR